MSELKLKPIVLLGNLTATEVWPALNVVLFGWGLLVFAPRWKYTKTLTLLPPFLHAGIYTLGLFSFVLDGSFAPDFNSLEGVVEMFKDPTNVFLGWTHYIVFDLLVARTIVLDSVERGVGLIGHVLIIIPCIFLTLMAGPFGWLLYMFFSLFLPDQTEKTKIP